MLLSIKTLLDGYSTGYFPNLLSNSIWGRELLFGGQREAFVSCLAEETAPLISAIQRFFFQRFYSVEKASLFFQYYNRSCLGGHTFNLEQLFMTL